MKLKKVIKKQDIYKKGGKKRKKKNKNKKNEKKFLINPDSPIPSYTSKFTSPQNFF